MLDLADRSWQRGVLTFSPFLTLYEQSVFHECTQEFGFVRAVLWGGYEEAERKIAGFFPAESYVSEAMNDYFPVRILSVRPLQEKFSDALTHRDYLGALMHLGVERERIGDIAVLEKEAYVFCHAKIADYLCGELARIRHTSVECRILDSAQVHYTPRIELMEGTVSSLRLDSLTTLAFKGSRGMFQELVQSGQVFVSGRLVTNCAARIREKDLISVRGCGKFCFLEEIGQTRKGRILVRIGIYR